MSDQQEVTCYIVANDLQPWRSDGHQQQSIYVTLCCLTGLNMVMVSWHTEYIHTYICTLVRWWYVKHLPGGSGGIF